MIYLILMLAGVLRLINLNQSLWLDEATQAILSRDSLNNIILHHGADFHPPLSYLLMHFWMMFNTSEIWLRLLSVVFGILSIWVLYKFLMRLFDKKIAIPASILLAVSPYHVYYSQEIRMYSELVFFALASMYFFQSLLKEHKFRVICGYVLSSTAMIYTHYDGFFLLAAQVAYLFFGGKGYIKKIWKYFAAIFLLWLPWIPQFLIQFRSGLNIDQYLPGWRQVLTISSYKSIPEILLKFTLGRVSLSGHLVIAIPVLLGVLLLLFQSIKNFKDKNLQLILTWFIIPLVLSWLFSFKIPLNQPFRLLYILPAFYILLSIGLQRLAKLRMFFLAALLIVSMSGLFFYYTNPINWREDWRNASQAVTKSLSANSVVLFAWPDPFPPYQWYANNAHGLGAVKIFPASKAEVEDSMKNLGKKNDIYFFEYLQQLSDPNKYIQQVLKEKGFKEDKVYNFNGVGFIDHYQ